MNINWQHYQAPYKEAIEEIPHQLQYLFSTEDPAEDIEYFLYNELAPNIKHQYKIYNIIEPVLKLWSSTYSKKGRFNIRLRF